MGKSMYSNQELTLKSTILTTSGAGATFQIYETGIDAEAASIVWKNASQLERFQIDIAIDGTCTIIKRGLDNTDTKVEVIALRKEWNNGAKGYITLLASDLLDVDSEDGIKNLKGDYNFEGDVEIGSVVTDEADIVDLNVTGKSKPYPEFATEILRDAFYTAPVNGNKATVAGNDCTFNGTTNQWEYFGISTPVPNASTIAAGKVQIATAKNNIDNIDGVYNMPTISQVNELIDDNITETQSILSNSDCLAGEELNKGDSLFVENRQTLIIGSQITDTNTQDNWGTSTSITQSLGVKIILNNSMIINNVVKKNSSTASRCLIKNEAGTILYTATFSTNTASFSGVMLSVGTYRIECDNNGSSYTAASDNAHVSVSGTNLTFSTGSSNGSDSSLSYNIDTINTSSIGYTDISNIGDIAANTRLAIKFIGSGLSSNSVTLGLAKFGSPLVNLKGRIEGNNNNIPNGEMLGQELSIDVSNLSTTIESKSLSFSTITQEFNNTDTLSLNGTVVNKSGIKIYIEKSSGLSSITKHSSCTATKCYIYDLLGQLITSSTFVNNVATLNASVVSGEYYYILLDNDGASYSNYTGNSISIIDLDGLQYLGGSNLWPNGNYSIDYGANSSSSTTDPIYTIGRDFTVKGNCYINKIIMSTSKDNGIRFLNKNGVLYATSDNQGNLTNILLEPGNTYTVYANSSTKNTNITTITPNGIISTATQGTGCSGVTSFSMNIVGIIGTETYRNNITKIILDDGISTNRGEIYRLVLYAGTYGSETLNSSNYYRIIYNLNDTSTRYGKKRDGTNYGTSDNKFYCLSSNFAEQYLLSKTNANYVYKLPDIIRLATKNYIIGEEVKYDYQGISKVFSGLNTNSAYYISNTPGILSTTPGTIKMFAGKSLLSNDFNIGGIDIITLSSGTTQYAPHNGFVSASYDGGSTNITLAGYSDNNTNPTTLVAIDSNGSVSGGTDACSITFPVKKGNYFKIIGTFSRGTYTQII